MEYVDKEGILIQEILDRTSTKTVLEGQTHKGSSLFEDRKYVFFYFPMSRNLSAALKLFCSLLNLGHQTTLIENVAKT